MQEIYPSFYHEFKCIANLCEDSCCKDWDIDIDSDTEEFYKTVQGSLGDKMRAMLVTDEYGERVFPCTDGRCPFWNRDKTCANFPRVAVDYGDFCEHILSFACPEAARFMLKNTREAYSDFGGERELDLSEDSGDCMSFLIKAREKTLDYLLNEGEPFAYRLADCLEFNAQVQSLLDGEEPEPLDLSGAESRGSGFIFDMHLGFEIMSGEWKSALSDTAEKAQKLKIRDDFASDFEKFALYYVYRYYLEAINSGDVLYSIKRIVCAYLVTGKRDYPYSRMRILQRYSKEVEHSYDNTEALNSAFDTDDRFEVESLIALLEQEI